MREFISFEEALTIVLEHAAPGPTEHVPLRDAQARTLAAPVVSDADIPPFANSAMDGFAVRSDDLETIPVVLEVAQDIPAGSVPREPVAPGTCARIMTGAPVPAGADAVVPVEWTEPAGDGAVRFNRDIGAGDNVRAAGEDVRRGARVLDAGEVITPPVIGMLATLGVAAVPVRRRPKVAVIATGDELVDAAETPRPGQIRNANGPALAAQVLSAGGEALPPLHAADDRTSLQRVVERALEADVLLFSGGVSVGDYDFVKEVLDAMGTRFLFWKVRQRPGKPIAFGRMAERLVFGLPGNPVSSAMCFEQYVRPALARMLGRQSVVRPRFPATLTAAMPKKAGLHYFARGVAAFGDDRRLHVRDTGPQGSNLYSSVVKANCIIHLPEPMEHPQAGTPVDVEWLGWSW